jgi:hypothetical protein
MIERDERPVEGDAVIAANDNAPNAKQVVVALRRIARLIGRQIAREESDRQRATNDNRRGHRGEV